MAITFDGVNKRIILSAGTISLDIADMYSRWKDWLALGNAFYLPAFAPVGGEVIDSGAGTSIPLYTFLLNGWRIKPQEASHTLDVVNGILLVDGGGDPFVNTTGSFVVRINFKQPVQAVTVATGGAAAGLTPTQEARLNELWKLAGLDATSPMTVTPSTRVAGDVSLAITGNPETSVTVQRQ